MIFKFFFVVNIALIAYLSLSPSTGVSVGNDKVGHFIAYAVLMLNGGFIALIARQAPHRLKRKLWFYLGFSVAFGMFMEVGQSYVPGRDTSFYDLLANIFGALFGFLLTNIYGNRVLNFLKSTKII